MNLHKIIIMKVKIMLFIIICFYSNSYSQRNSLRKQVGVQQLDSRFTFSIEKYWSGIADEESYYIYVTNNTADEYMLEIEFDLTLNCYDVKPRKLGVNGKVYLKPYAEQKYEGHYMITSDREKQKSCLIAEGDTYTLYRSHTWQILSKINLTQQKADKKEAVNKSYTVVKNNNQQNASFPSDDNTVKSALINASTGETVVRDKNKDVTNISNSVIVNGTAIKVYRQNGKYYIQKTDGSVIETNQCVYDAIQNVSIK